MIENDRTPETDVSGQIVGARVRVWGSVPIPVEPGQTS